MRTTERKVVFFSVGYLGYINIFATCFVTDLLVHVPMDSISGGVIPAIGTSATVHGTPGSYLLGHVYWYLASTCLHWLQLPSIARVWPVLQNLSSAFTFWHCFVFYLAPAPLSCQPALCVKFSKEAGNAPFERFATCPEKPLAALKFSFCFLGIAVINEVHTLFRSIPNSRKVW